MARAALSAARAIEIIDFLAAHSPAAFSLSEMVRALDVNIASMHAILGALVQSGHLSRHPKRKTYALGPALIGIGGAAQLGDEVYQRAAPLLEPLSRDLGVDTLLSVRLEDEIMGLCSVERRASSRSWLRTGQRLPLLPPQGAALMAWETEEAVAQWIARASKGPPDAELSANLRALLKLVRENGYEVSLRQPMPSDLKTLAGSYLKTRYIDDLQRQMVDFQGVWNRSIFDLSAHADDAVHEVGFLSIPLFNQDGRATHSLSLFNFDHPLRISEIRDLVSAAMSACASLVWDRLLGSTALAARRG